MDGIEEDKFDKLIKQLVSEINLMEYSGNLRAVGIIAVDKDGDIKITYGYNDGTKLAMIAGSVMLQNNLLDEMKKGIKEPKDYGK